MCTLHLFFRVFPGAPVLLAATRDELLDRPWDPPALLAEAPRIFGPRDVLAGGTWLGVNEAGVLVTLANHEGTLREDKSPSLCSRGAHVLEALRRGSAAEAMTHAEREAPVCKAYTLLIADPGGAYVVDRSPTGSRTHSLAPGCHVVTNTRFRQPGDVKASRCLQRMEALAAGGTLPSVRQLSEFLSDHETDSPAVRPLCIHPQGSPRYGTSSASIVQIADDRRLERFLFAGGPPCTTEFRDVTPAILHRTRPCPADSRRERREPVGGEP